METPFFQGTTRRFIGVCFLCFMVSATIFGRGGEETSAKPEHGNGLKVVATTNILGDVISQVGGDDIILHVLIERGQDPHSFESTPKTLALIESADIIFINGFRLEESLLDDIEAAATGDVIVASRNIDPLIPGHEEEHENGDHAEHEDEQDDHGEESHEHGEVDPHVWFDPTNVTVWVDTVEKVLKEADPKNADNYQRRAAAYREELRVLDASIRQRSASLPAEKRKLVTDHDLLGYFAEEYEFQIIGAIIPTMSGAAETSARHMADLVKLLRSENIDAIFIGETAGRGMEKLADNLAAELDREIQIVSILTGSLTEPGGAGDSYINYMEYNIEKIFAALTAQ